MANGNNHNIALVVCSIHMTQLRALGGYKRLRATFCRYMGMLMDHSQWIMVDGLYIIK
jgi:hypothetical protein